MWLGDICCAYKSRRDRRPAIEAPRLIMISSRYLQNTWAGFMCVGRHATHTVVRWPRQLSVNWSRQRASCLRTPTTKSSAPSLRYRLSRMQIRGVLSPSSLRPWPIFRAAVGMGIPMGIPMGMGMVWVWGLWWIPMGSVGNLWGFLNGCNVCGIETNLTNSEFVFS